MTKRTCSIEGCGKPVLARGWCPMHYQRWRTSGTTDDPPSRRNYCQCGEPVHGRGMCRKCYRADYYQRNREAENAWFRAYYRDNAETLRAVSAAWYWANREQASARAILNRERAKAQRRELMKDPTRRQRRRDKQREWRRANPERWALRNRENQRRRDAQKRATQNEPVDYAAILAEHGMFCHICSMVIVDESDLHFDHVIPLALGGPHTAENIRPAHAICNMRKGAKAS